jgi:carbon storage regulator
MAVIDRKPSDNDPLVHDGLSLSNVARSMLASSAPFGYQSSHSLMESKMLTLSRKRDQQIIIGGDIRVIVLGIHGDRVKLGFVAPDEVPVRREVAHLRIVHEEEDSELMAMAH